MVVYVLIDYDDEDAVKVFKSKEEGVKALKKEAGTEGILKEEWRSGHPWQMYEDQQGELVLIEAEVI